MRTWLVLVNWYPIINNNKAELDKQARMNEPVIILFFTIFFFITFSVLCCCCLCCWLRMVMYWYTIVRPWYVYLSSQIVQNCLYGGAAHCLQKHSIQFSFSVVTLRTNVMIWKTYVDSIFSMHKAVFSSNGVYSEKINETTNS